MARMMASMLRRVVAVGLVSMFALLLVSPLVACGGWQASAAARHACCVRMGCDHSVDSDANVDACCARKESASNPSQAERSHFDGTVALVPTVLVGSPDTWLLAPDNRSVARQTETLPPHAESSLYLRYSLLRI